MRGVVTRFLNHLSTIGIFMALATGVLGMIGVPEPLFTAVVGCLIGLLGAAANLMVLLAVLEVRRVVLDASIARAKEAVIQSYGERPIMAQQIRIFTPEPVQIRSRFAHVFKPQVTSEQTLEDSQTEEAMPVYTGSAPPQAMAAMN